MKCNYCKIDGLPMASPSSYNLLPSKTKSSYRQYSKTRFDYSVNVPKKIDWSPLIP